MRSESVPYIAISDLPKFLATRIAGYCARRVERFELTKNFLCSFQKLYMRGIKGDCNCASKTINRP